MGDKDQKTTRSSSIKFTINGTVKTLEHEYELDGVKFTAKCIPQRKSEEPYYKSSVTISCNGMIFNNLWACTASFEVLGDIVRNEPKIVKFDFDRYNKYLVINDLLCNALTPITLKTTLENVVGYQIVPLFDFEVPGFSDVTFLIGENHVYAHRSILAINSTYFSAMFVSRFAEKTMAEIRLEDVNAVEFIDFLNALYPTNFEVSENNVKFLLRLADMYHAERVLNKCVKFLETTDKIKLSEKLDYAERYRLGSLEKTCIENLKSVNDIKSLLNELPANYKEDRLNCISEPMQTKILERFTELSVPDFCILEESSKMNSSAENKTTVEQKFEEWKDTVLKIEGVELLVNRSYLSVFSSYFREWFHEDIEKDSFELENVKCDEFLEFLAFLQEPDKIITETVIDNISSLSERFGVAYLLNRCKQYWEDVIQQNDTKPLYNSVMCVLFNASEKFRFSEIQERILSRMRAKNEMKDVMISPEFNQLGPKSRLAILRCYFTSNSADF